MSIYVETVVRGSLEDVWERTQRPELHERWDLRFTRIEYLPRAAESEPQRFRYSTRLGFGLAINGAGETVGNRDAADGGRTSALRFWSDDPKSLIRHGTGYWKYMPTGDGVRFITGYDYEVRFGLAGRLLDRLVFRPLMGWATAWSFDRLRLWIERGIDPAVSRQRAVIHAVARLSVAFVWLYHGLIPKVLFLHADELRMLHDAGIPSDLTPLALHAVGWAEVIVGLLVLVLVRVRDRWPLVATIVLMLAATAAVAINSPAFLIAAFNPITLNLLTAAMALIALLSLRDLPSASRCRRKPESAR